jgi:hypothetical protein
MKITLRTRSLFAAALVVGTLICSSVLVFVALVVWLSVKATDEPKGTRDARPTIDARIPVVEQPDLTKPRGGKPPFTEMGVNPVFWVDQAQAG